MDVTSSRGFAVQRGIQSSACLDIDNLLDPELKKRLGEPLERPLRAARPQRPQEAKVMSEVYARIAKECGKPLLEDVWRPTSHERFDASLENATRVFASVAHDIQDLFRIHEWRPQPKQDAESSRRTAMDPPVPKRMHKLLSKESLLICHSLLGLRWCFVPFTVLILSRSVLVACQLGGHFAAWSLAVLLADASQRDKESSDWKATISLMLALGLSAAALYCLPLMGLEALAALLVYLLYLVLPSLLDYFLQPPHSWQMRADISKDNGSSFGACCVSTVP
eukprot:symbB.v1.2.013516.t1/scaffold795.1/size259473/8